MYVHLGQDAFAVSDEIIGIFDMDTATVQKSTRDFLSEAEKKGEVINVSAYELPKTFVLCKTKDGKRKIYISPVSPATLQRRAGVRRTIYGK
ncbi:MAG: DUF370 domain-containing protein [Clostridiales bacterium]|nr:DUF370 domain-containing protein [Clostridiales bacterium]